jgi:hypothetical protein
MTTQITPDSTTIAAVATDKLEGYVNRYKNFANKSAENILEMCKVVYEAGCLFNPTPFRKFCDQVGLTDKGTISKMKRIGSRYAVLAPYLNFLPCSWTTLYRIAKLPHEKFIEAIGQGKLTIYTTAQQLSEIAPPLRRPNPYGIPEDQSEVTPQTAATEDLNGCIEASYTSIHTDNDDKKPGDIDAKSANDKFFMVRLGASITPNQKDDLYSKLNRICADFGVELVAA